MGTGQSVLLLSVGPHLHPSVPAPAAPSDPLSHVTLVFSPSVSPLCLESSMALGAATGRRWEAPFLRKKTDRISVFIIYLYLIFLHLGNTFIPAIPRNVLLARGLWGDDFSLRNRVGGEVLSQ